MRAVLEIIKPGVGLSVQDAGRPGWQSYGVPTGGALDRRSMQAANRLLGNPLNCPVLEIMMGGLEVRVLETTWLGLAGAELLGEIAVWSAEQVSAGTKLRFKAGRTGLWTYLAVPGGVHAKPYFSSCSTDVRNGMGEAFHDGDSIYACSPALKERFPGIKRRRCRLADREEYLPSERFRLLPGPQFGSFSETAKEQLVSQRWVISARSDRTGYRLQGHLLEPAPPIHSEAVLPGSFQITTNGSPIVTLPFGPTVGGYPKIALLKEADLGRFAQCRPGTEVQFIWDDC